LCTSSDASNISSTVEPKNAFTSRTTSKTLYLPSEPGFSGSYRPEARSEIATVETVNLR